MIVFNPSKLKFIPHVKRSADFPYDEINGTKIIIKDIWGNVIYEMKYEDGNLKLNGYTFTGQFDYLRIHRGEKGLIDKFKVEISCQNCGDVQYPLSGKLPSLLIINTDFHVEKG